MDTLKRFAPVMLLAALVGVSLTGCGTVAGAGRDVSATGNAITQTANDAKPR